MKCPLKKATAQHGKGSAAPDSPVISQPMPVNTARSAAKTLSSTTGNLEVVPPSNLDVVPMLSSEKSTSEKIREENAAVKAQAAFRGYLVFFFYDFSLFHILFLSVCKCSQQLCIVCFSITYCILPNHIFIFLNQD